MADQAVPPCPSGIYCIRNTVSGRVYVGSAVDIKNRWRVHLGHIRRDTHHSKQLLASWRKHGPDAFDWIVLEYVPNKLDLIRREQWWLDELRAADRRFGFNTAPTAGSQLGICISDEARANMSKGQTGRKNGPPSEAHRALISAAMTGRKHSPERCAQTSERGRGRKMPPMSDEHKAKISDALKAAHVRRPRGVPKAALAASIVANTGIVRSVETLSRMRAASRAFLARKLREAGQLDMLEPPQDQKNQENY